MWTQKYEPHPYIKGVLIMEGKINFPISWLNQQGFCEYSLYLEHVQGIELAATPEMIKGQQIHQNLDTNFKQDATETNFAELMKLSKREEYLTREMFVLSTNYGIRGSIDEIWLTPDEFIIIDDKPGTVAYQSTINQVWGYCLAFQDFISGDNRKIIGALRERGTDNIYWMEEFKEFSQIKIKKLLQRMQDMFTGSKHFIPTNNSRKCAKCRFNTHCEFK